MIVSSRSDDRRRLRASAFLFSMALASSAMAQDGNEVVRLAEEARQAFLAAEQGNASAKQKASSYQVARARLMLLEKFSGQTAAGSSELRDGARAELNRLADEGLSHDTIGSMLLQASLGDITGGQAVDRVEVGIALHQIASEQRSPSYRAAAFIEIAYAYGKANAPDRALRYASLALETAATIPEVGAQAGALNAVARVSAGLGVPGAALANRAIRLIPSARSRAYARHEFAREQLKGSALEKAPEAKVRVEAKKRLATRDLSGAIALALALPDSKDREELLSAVLGAAIERQDRDVALAAADGFFDSSRQQKALSLIVENDIESGSPLQAVEIVNSLQVGPGKLLLQLNLAGELKRSGYDGMADELFSAGRKALEASTDIAQVPILPDVIRALTRAGQLDEALLYAGRIGSGTDASSGLGGLAKRLADKGRIADAQALLPRIEGKGDRSHALSGIGRAKAKAGDITGAMAILAELADDEDAARVLAAVVQAHTNSNNFVQAMSLAERIGKVDDRIEALAGIARQAVQTQDHIGERALVEAIRLAESQEGSLRDEVLLSIVRDRLEIGDRTRVVELKERIGDSQTRKRAEELIVRAETTDLIERHDRGQVSDAILTSSLDKISNDEDKADLAYKLASLPSGGSYAVDLIRSIANDQTRGRAFRQVAEMQADHLTAASHETGDEVGDGVALASLPAGAEERDQEVQTRRGLTLIKTEAVKPAVERPLMPKSFVKADDVRSKIPLPGNGAVGITFANHNPYVAKFFEDGADGATRLEQAIRYQGLPSPRIIVVQSGIVTLGTVARQLQGSDARDLIAYEGDAVTVRAPIFVAPGARLILSRLDAPTYRLSANAGAFIVNAGDVDIVDAEVVGYDEKSGQPLWSDSGKADQFRPFLLTWSDGRMNVASSVLVALGYDNAKSFGLTYSSGTDRVAEYRDQRPPSGIVVDNVFRNFYLGLHAYEAERVQVVGNEYRNSVVHALDSHDRSKGFTIALNTAYGTMLRHGITVSRGVDDNLIIGNLSFDNAGSGIVLDRDSTNNVLYANSSFRNAQDGVTVFESSCNVLTSNLLSGNKRDGLKVRNSFDVGAYGNRIEANANSGVSAYIANISVSGSADNQNEKPTDYASVAGLSLRHNRFSSNGVGINTQGVSGLALFSNRFVNQSHRLLGGDIRGLEGPVLRLAFQSDVLIASTCRPVKPVSSCRLRDAGFFEGGANLQIFNPQASSDCTDVNGTVQHRAFSNSSRGT